MIIGIGGRRVSLWGYKGGAYGGVGCLWGYKGGAYGGGGVLMGI